MGENRIGMISIRHRISGNVLFSGEYLSVREALEAAVKAKVNHECAYLANAYLANA